MRVRIGIIGKTNTGKTTFFSSATMKGAEISTYPFTTKHPNEGIANAITLCVCGEFGIKGKDNPKNSACVEGWRYIPVELIDLPGLIKGAHAGKGLGNQFLSVAAQSDALIHMVDASGSVDEEGRLTEPGAGNPVADVWDIEEELVLWLSNVIERWSHKISKEIGQGKKLPEAMENVMRGLKVTEEHVRIALKRSGLEGKEFDNWTGKDDQRFAKELREVAKPTVIVANKMDLANADENLKKLQEAFPDKFIVPASAEAELILRKAETAGYIKYRPGDEKFHVVDETKLDEKQRWALNYVERKILGEYMRTGVQFAINMTVFKLLGMNAVYPVYDVERLSDKEGNVLPDVILLPPGSTVRDLAMSVHSDLAKGLLYAIDARDKVRLPADYKVKDRDVLSILSTTRRG